MRVWLAQLESQIVTAESGEFWWYAGLGAILIVVGWVVAFRAIRRARLIEDVPTSRIRSAVQGYVELVGHAEAMDGPVIVAPLSGLSCVWYRYRVEERRRSGKHTRWHTVEKGVSDSLFLLRDETGSCCVVDPEGAEVSVHEVQRWGGTHPRPQSKPPMRRRQAGWINVFFSMGRYRYTEWRLDEHDPLYAIGRFRTIGGGQGLTPLKDDVRELVAKWKQQPEILAKFDQNNDGQIDMSEWEALRKAAHQQALNARLRAAEAPAVHVMQKPDDGRLYLLSTHDPVKMVQGYRWTGRTLLTLAIVGGAALLAVLKMRLS